MLYAFVFSQSMYLSGTNVQVLLSKGEALIDRYIDTTTPPWVKVIDIKLIITVYC